MATVTVPVAIPSLLHGCTGGLAEVTVRAGTLAEAIENLLGAYPLLRTNLEDERYEASAYFQVNIETTAY